MCNKQQWDAEWPVYGPNASPVAHSAGDTENSVLTTIHQEQDY